MAYIDCDKCYHGIVCAYRHQYDDHIVTCSHWKPAGDVVEVVMIASIKHLKAEAIKEFAERLKASAFECDVSFGFGREHYTEAVAVVEIDNLVKEMTEDKP